MIKTLFCFAAAAVMANAASYRLNLLEHTVVNGQELKPGDYKLELNEQSATIERGKTSLTVPVRVESSGKKIPVTALRYQQQNGQLLLREIRIGGSNTKLFLDSGREMAGGGQ